MALKRIIVHSNAPWAPSGYGQQTALLTPRLRSLGYDVAVSTFSNLSGAPVNWNSIPVLPSGQDPYGADVIPAHVKHTHADLVIMIHDVWVIDGSTMCDVPLACWIPLDADKLGEEDHKFLSASGAIPIAMSRHGEQILREAGHNPLYVPHAVDTAVFTPRADRDELREQMNVSGKFVVGMLAANKDAIRKCFFEQFEAFARFHAIVPESVLLVNSIVTGPGALDLLKLAENCGILDAVQFSDQYRTLMGLQKPSDIASWLSVLDVLTNTSMGEGFGITPLEAMACGIPAIVNDCSAMTELSLGPEWMVSGQDFWNPTHIARWQTPNIEQIKQRYLEAHKRLSDPAEKQAISKLAREKALAYDINRVMSEYWQPALIAIDKRLAEKRGEVSEHAAARDAEQVGEDTSVVLHGAQPAVAYG